MPEVPSTHYHSQLWFLSSLVVNCFDGELVVEVIVGGISPFRPPG